MSSEHSETEHGRSSRWVSRSDRVATRGLDLVGAGLGLVVLSPLLLGLALAVRLNSPGPALFRSIRVGQKGRPFTLYKFRSMIAGAETIGPAITAADDRRITPVGNRLRRFKLDELPQLLNVVKGDMTLVGPRPEAPAFVALYSRDELAILEARPGITSPASLEYRDEESHLTGDDWRRHYTEVLMPAKLAIDGDYVRRRSFISDLGVIVQTLVALGRKSEP